MSHHPLSNDTIYWDWLFRSVNGRRWLLHHCKHRLVTSSSPHEYAVNMHAGLKFRHARSSIAFFRLPRQRLYSNYLHINFHYRHDKPSRMTLHQFLKRPRFLSQHVKILLGLDYVQPTFMSLSEANRAVEIVDKLLAFVGLTEQFELSVRLFHAKFGGVPHRLQFENVRPSIKRYTDSERMSYDFRYGEKEFGAWNDEPDELVYKAARARFWRDICIHRKEIQLDGLGHLPVTSCMFQTYAPSTCLQVI